MASNNTRVWRLDAAAGLLVHVAGNGIAGYGGDGRPATSAQIIAAGIAVDSADNLYIADAANSRIRKVSGGIITTVAGNGTPGFKGDGIAALNAQLNAPVAVALDSAGTLYFVDANNNRVRKVSGGVITTFVGGASSGDNDPATNARLLQPTGVAVDSAGNLYVVDAQNRTLRKVTNGVMSTVAGGDGTAVDAGGNLLVADVGNRGIRQVSNGTPAVL